MLKKILNITFLAFILVMALSIPAFAADTPQISGRAHIQDIGWVDVPADGNHLLLGTVGQAKRIEAINLRTNDPNVSLIYQTHVQDIGWMDFVGAGQDSGTSGQAKRIECFNIGLVGDNASNYTLFYRTHVENYGWLDWAVSGQHAGTAQHAYRCEAIEFLIVPAGTPAPGRTTTPAVEATCREEAVFMKLVNDLRSSHGLNYVTGDPNLRAVAIVRLNELPVKFSHIRPNGLSYETAVKDVFPNYKYNGGGFIESLIFGATKYAKPAEAFWCFCAYPNETDKLLQDAVRYVSWASKVQGTMAYSIFTVSGLDRIDFAD